MAQIHNALMTGLWTGAPPSMPSRPMPGQQSMTPEELRLLKQLYGDQGPGGHGRFGSGWNFGRNAFGQIGGFGGGGLASLGGFPGLGPPTSGIAGAQNALAALNAGRSSPLTFNDFYRDGGGQTPGTGPPDISLSQAEIDALASDLNSPIGRAIATALGLTPAAAPLGLMGAWTRANATGGLLGPAAVSGPEQGPPTAEQAAAQSSEYGGASLGAPETAQGVSEFGSGYGGVGGEAEGYGGGGDTSGGSPGGGAEGPGGTGEPGGNWRRGGYVKPDKDKKLERKRAWVHEGEVWLSPERVKHLGKKNALAIHMGKYNRNKLREALR